jgi:GTP-binding protein LepA
VKNNKEEINLNSEKHESLKALIFDLLYSRYYGVIIYVRIFEGELKKGQKIKFFTNQERIYQVERLGVKTPKEILKEKLVSGEIGWFAANVRDMREVKVGDTVIDLGSEILPLEGYQEVKSNVYSNLYPSETSRYKEFKKSLEELQTQDSSLNLESIDSQLLGPGFRCGFLGLLHREVICERLEKEFNCEIITTPPNINYQITFANGESLETNNPQKIPTKEKIKNIKELFINLNITTPEEYLGSISQLCQNKRGIYQSQEWKTGSLYQLTYHLPFAEFIIDFHDKIKSISHGYASFDYQLIGFQPSDIVKIDILLNNQLIPDLSFLVHRSFSYDRAKVTCENLKTTLNQQTFTVPIQATIGNQVIARETLPALKKHVTGNMYGGDRTRKMKLWAKQKKGKARMKEMGKVSFGAGSLRELLKSNKSHN